jgi:hypothetical protein
MRHSWPYLIINYKCFHLNRRTTHAYLIIQSDAILSVHSYLCIPFNILTYYYTAYPGSHNMHRALFLAADTLESRFRIPFGVWMYKPCSVSVCIDIVKILRRSDPLIALMMEAPGTSETSVNFYQTARCNYPEYSHLHIRLRENLKSQVNIGGGSDLLAFPRQCSTFCLKIYLRFYSSFVQLPT